MSKVQATNNFVFIIRDEIETEKAGLVIPGVGREKPHQGIIYSVGELTKDRKIKAGKRAIYHKGVGFSIEVDEQEYLVLMDSEVIGIK